MADTKTDDNGADQTETDPPEPEPNSATSSAPADESPPADSSDDPPRPAGDDTAPADEHVRRRWIGLAAGVILGALVFLLLMMFSDLNTNGCYVAGIATLMAVWWMTEAIPLPATALIPLVAFPFVQVIDEETGQTVIDEETGEVARVGIADVAAPYANSIIFLFMAGFIIALAMQRWNLHRRFALAVVSAVGTSPVMLVFGFMIATGFVTMWVSNTATAIMMLPIGLAVLGLVNQNNGGRTDPKFATALMLGIAYAASIGSVATLIGTPPNAILRANLEAEGISIGFAEWMLAGIPLAAVFLVIGWFVLTKLVFRPEITELHGGRELIRQELRDMGRISRGEWTVLGVFAAAVFCWVATPSLQESETVMDAWPWLEYVDDAGIAMAAALALFLIPVDAKRGIRAIDWNQAVKLPWGILLLFGGGLSLSGQFTQTGLSNWIGIQVQELSDVPTWVVILTVTAMVLLLTELTSNTATANIFIPVMIGVSAGLGLDAMTLAVPAALAASLAFMLPVATPPNAIVFGSGHVTIGQMIRGGVWLNIVGLFLVMGAMYTTMSWVFDFSV